MFGSFRDLAFMGAAAGSGVALDPDAQAYITAVENVDGQALEAGVRTAINDFVVGCKADGIWTAIKASCIMAGARTRLGAMVPLVGAAPTSFNFVDEDYDRKTGLKGNGVNKELKINNSASSLFASPINSSFGVWVSEKETNPANLTTLLGDTGSSIRIDHQDNASLRSRVNDGANTAAAGTNGIGFVGTGRNPLLNIKTLRGSGTTINNPIGPNASLSTSDVYIFSRSVGHTNARLGFYWLGDWIDLALLDARVTALINAFGAAIP
jgi:hypothetical protein